MRPNQVPNHTHHYRPKHGATTRLASRQVEVTLPLRADINNRLQYHSANNPIVTTTQIHRESITAPYTAVAGRPIPGTSFLEKARKEAQIAARQQRGYLSSTDAQKNFQFTNAARTISQTTTTAPERSQAHTVAGEHSQTATVARGRSKDTAVGRGRSKDTAVGRGRSKDTAVGRGRSKDTAVGRGRSQDTTVGRGRSKDTAVGRGRSKDTAVGRKRSKDTTIARGRFKDTTVTRGSSKDTTVTRDHSQTPAENHGFTQTSTVARERSQITTKTRGRSQITVEGRGRSQTYPETHGQFQSSPGSRGHSRRTAEARELSRSNAAEVPGLNRSNTAETRGRPRTTAVKTRGRSRTSAANTRGRPQTTTAEIHGRPRTTTAETLGRSQSTAETLGHSQSPAEILERSCTAAIALGHSKTTTVASGCYQPIVKSRGHPKVTAVGRGSSKTTSVAHSNFQIPPSIPSGSLITESTPCGFHLTTSAPSVSQASTVSWGVSQNAAESDLVLPGTHYPLLNAKPCIFGATTNLIETPSSLMNTGNFQGLEQGCEQSMLTLSLESTSNLNVDKINISQREQIGSNIDQELNVSVKESSTASLDSSSDKGIVAQNTQQSMNFDLNSLEISPNANNVDPKLTERATGSFQSDLQPTLRNSALASTSISNSLVSDMLLDPNQDKQESVVTMSNKDESNNILEEQSAEALFREMMGQNISADVNQPFLIETSEETTADTTELISPYFFSEEARQQPPQLSLPLQVGEPAGNNKSSKELNLKALLKSPCRTVSKLTHWRSITDSDDYASPTKKSRMSSNPSSEGRRFSYEGQGSEKDSSTGKSNYASADEHHRLSDDSSPEIIYEEFSSLQTNLTSEANNSIQSSIYSSQPILPIPIGKDIASEVVLEEITTSQTRLHSSQRAIESLIEFETFGITNTMIPTVSTNADEDHRLSDDSTPEIIYEDLSSLQTDQSSGANNTQQESIYSTQPMLPLPIENYISSEMVLDNIPQTRLHSSQSQIELPIEFETPDLTKTMIPTTVERFDKKFQIPTSVERFDKKSQIPTTMERLDKKTQIPTTVERFNKKFQTFKPNSLDSPSTSINNPSRMSNFSNHPLTTEEREFLCSKEILTSSHLGKSPSLKKYSSPYKYSRPREQLLSSESQLLPGVEKIVSSTLSLTGKSLNLHNQGIGVVVSNTTKGTNTSNLTATSSCHRTTRPVLQATYKMPYPERPIEPVARLLSLEKSPENVVVSSAAPTLSDSQQSFQDLTASLSLPYDIQPIISTSLCSSSSNLQRNPSSTQDVMTSSILESNSLDNLNENYATAASSYQGTQSNFPSISQSQFSSQNPTPEHPSNINMPSSVSMSQITGVSSFQGRLLPNQVLQPVNFPPPITFHNRNPPPFSYRDKLKRKSAMFSQGERSLYQSPSTSFLRPNYESTTNLITPTTMQLLTASMNVPESSISQDYSSISTHDSSNDNTPKIYSSTNSEELIFPETDDITNKEGT